MITRTVIIIFLALIITACSSESQAKKMGKNATKTMSSSIGNAMTRIGKAAASTAGKAIKR